MTFFSNKTLFPKVLLVSATIAILATDVIVFGHQGGIRGLTTMTGSDGDHDGIATVLNEEERRALKNHDRRLKEENKNNKGGGGGNKNNKGGGGGNKNNKGGGGGNKNNKGGGGGGGSAPMPTAPVAPRPTNPTAPPGPSPIDQFIAKCGPIPADDVCVNCLQRVSSSNNNAGHCFTPCSPDLDKAQVEGYVRCGTGEQPAPAPVTPAIPQPAPVMPPTPAVVLPAPVVPPTPAVVLPAPVVPPTPAVVLPAPVKPPTPAVVLPAPVPSSSGGGLAIPSGIQLAGTGATCPDSASIQCSPCELTAGNFEGTCEGYFTDPTYGFIEVQCRCYTQEITDPVWTCRYIAGGQAGTPMVPVSPSCTGNDYNGPDNFGPPLPGPPDNETPENMITVADPIIPVVATPPPPGNGSPIQQTIPPTTECTPRLPTSGLTPCNMPPEQICCHRVATGQASVCICLDGYFQCNHNDFTNDDCPCDQDYECIRKYEYDEDGTQTYVGNTRPEPDPAPIIALIAGSY